MKTGIIKWINRSGDFSKLLESRVILYLFVAISMVNLYTNAVSQEGVYSVIFILVSFLTSFFSKNMIVILCIGIVVSNVLKSGSQIRVSEGFESNEEKISDETSDLEVDTLAEDADTEDKSVDKAKNMKNNKKVQAEEEYKRLLKYQKELMDGVTTLAPVLKSANESLEKIKLLTETK